MSAAFWVCAAITVISSLVSLGYAASAVRSSQGPDRRNALYAFSRSVALAVAATTALFNRSAGWLEGVALAMIVVQASDAVIGARIRDRLKTVGPALTAVANLAALINFAH